MPVTRRGNSKYWYIQFQLNHRTIIRSARTTDKRVAERLESKLRAEAYDDLILGKKRSVTLEWAVSDYIDSRIRTPNHSNLVSHKRTILRILDGGTQTQRLSGADLERFKQVRLAEGCSGQTIKHGLNVLMGALRNAKRNGFDVAELSPPVIKVGKGRTRFLTDEEEKALLRELDPRREGRGLSPYAERSAGLLQSMQDSYDLVVILLDTGARHGEIASLPWANVDLAARTIQLWRPKVQNEGVIFMTDRVFDTLTRRYASRFSDYIFANRQNGPRNYTVTAIRKAMNRAGLTDCTVHTLRHTHATRLIQNGLSVYEVKSVLGHTDIRTTMRYAHLEQAKVTSKARDVINKLNSGTTP
jgi:integrase